MSIAALVGVAAGLEREWSGHTAGADARFAGLRTFFLLGVTGGAAGILAAADQPFIAAAIVAGAAALCVAGYLSATRRDGSTTDGTTEAAGIVVVTLGVIAGNGWLRTAAGAGAIVVLMLREKNRLHLLVKGLAEQDVRAGVQFAVLAVVVLPLLPSGPYLGWLAIKPRALWTIVLLFSGLNFAGFIARRVVGPSRGLGITGALGGVISSTAVTLNFARQSSTETMMGRDLARGVVAACTVLIPRVLVLSAVLNSLVALSLVKYLLPAFLAGLAMSLIGWRSRSTEATATNHTESNPLRLGAAIQMAVAFQVAMILIDIVRARWGTPGVFATGAMLGLTDVDALTVSMSRSDAALAADTAARAIAVGILANTLLKMGIALVLGRAMFRRRAATSLAALALASAMGFLFA